MADSELLNCSENTGTAAGVRSASFQDGDDRTRVHIRRGTHEPDSSGVEEFGAGSSHADAHNFGRMAWLVALPFEPVDRSESG